MESNRLKNPFQLHNGYLIAPISCLWLLFLVSFCFPLESYRSPIDIPASRCQQGVLTVMEDKDVFSSNPSENHPIWTQPGTTIEYFFSFDQDFTTEFEALPTLSRPHIPSISLPIKASVIQDYTGPPLLPGSLMVAKSW